MKQGRRQYHSAALADGRPPRRDYARQMGLRELGEQDPACSSFEDWTAEDDCALPVGDFLVGRAAAHRRERVYLSLPDYWATFSVAAFSLAPHQAASRLTRSAVA